MVDGLRRIIAWFRDRDGNEAVDAAFRRMLPGMLVEQFAAILLANVNVFVSGLISSEALAGVAQISTLNSILMNAFQAFSIGGTAMVARRIGAGEKREASAMATAAVAFGTLVSGALSLVIFALHRPIVLWLFGRAEPAVVNNSIAYFSCTALAPAMWFIYFQCCGFLRSAGDTRTPMLISVALNSMSILLNLVFSLGLRMGVRGAALSYLLSVTVAAALSLAMVLRRNAVFRLRPCGIGELRRGVGSICPIALPSTLQNLAFNGSRIVLQVFLASMGTAMVAANQVFNSVNEILLVPFMAIYCLIVPLVGLSAGKSDVKGVRRVIAHLVRRSMGWAVLTGLAHFLLCVPLALLFSRDARVVRVACHMALIFGVVSPLQSTCFVLPNGLTAVGDARFPMVFSSLTAWGIRVFGTWLLGVKLGWGAYVIIVTQALDYVARSVAYGLRFRGDRWEGFLSREAQTGAARQ